MNTGDVFEAEDAHGVRYELEVVWSGAAGHYLCDRHGPQVSQATSRRPVPRSYVATHLPVSERSLRA